MDRAGKRFDRVLVKVAERDFKSDWAPNRGIQIRAAEGLEVIVAPPPLYIVVRLWIHEGLEAKFEAYERKVSRVMARYGGIIERAIRTTRASNTSSDEPFEVHLLRFPTRELYDAYQDDPERRSLSGERGRIIIKTDAFVGTLGPTYGS